MSAWIHFLIFPAPATYLCVACPILFPTLMLAQVRAELYKLSSLSLCSNTIGQLATGIMINPPKPGDPSFETFKKVSTAYACLLKADYLPTSEW